MPRLTIIMLAQLLGACVYPGISLNKGRLLDPTMDPAKTGIMADSLPSLTNRSFERSAIGTGGSSGGACPTCK